MAVTVQQSPLNLSSVNGLSRQGAARFVQENVLLFRGKEAVKQIHMHSVS